jgi:hypothetical protein
MTTTNKTLSERVREALGDHSKDPQLLQDIAWTEMAAAGRVTHVATNGKHPKDWSLERWLTVILFGWTVGAGIWFFSDQWSDLQARVASIDRSLISLSTKVEAVDRDRQVDVAALEALIRQIDRAVPPLRLLSPAAAEMTFPREEQFSASGGQR